MIGDVKEKEAIRKGNTALRKIVLQGNTIGQNASSVLSVRGPLRTRISVCCEQRMTDFLYPGNDYKHIWQKIGVAQLTLRHSV